MVLVDIGTSRVFSHMLKNGGRRFARLPTLGEDAPILRADVTLAAPGPRTCHFPVPQPSSPHSDAIVDTSRIGVSCGLDKRPTFPSQPDHHTPVKSDLLPGWKCLC
ncbi:hypothetical protein TNCV_566861 [Trichonephila clavipes]|nr:hypothetical protein TNCV_566861 [Trichonephila clavipes]